MLFLPQFCSIFLLTSIPSSSQFQCILTAFILTCSLSMYKYRRISVFDIRVTSRENMSSEVCDQVILEQICCSEALLSVWMRRLICAFVVRICHKTGFLMTKNTISQSTIQKLANTEVVNELKEQNRSYAQQIYCNFSYYLMSIFNYIQKVSSGVSDQASHKQACAATEAS